MGSVPTAVGTLDGQAPIAAYTLQTLLERRLLAPGDLLDPVDPEWAIDAIVSDEGTVLIDGVHRFDDLDDAARFVGVNNIDGIDFWALETEEGLVALSRLHEGA